MFIPVNVIFSDRDPDEAEMMGIKVKTIVGELMINTDNICGFNKNDNGNTNIRLANGEVHEAKIGYETFKKLIASVEEKTDTIISGKN